MSLDEQLLHAQKLETIGQLTGGVAHAFNNTLTAIRGYSELLLSRLEPDSPLHKEVEAIRRTAEQGASLPRRLLEFGRKQERSPERLDVAEIVDAAAAVLRQVLGARIEVVVSHDAVGSLVVADAGELEQIVLNLALNARDAMPDGGRLTLETRSDVVDAREYVVLGVSDTGVGMDEETQARVFEPFFTTKEAGKGSGLGLSTAQSIAQESGGFLSVRSAPGRGSSFELYLPCESSTDADRPVTVLLTEDEEAVRTMLVSVLEGEGFRVIAADCGETALAAAAADPGAIDVLVTDIVMPGLSGLQLAERVVAQRPRTRVIYISGHAKDKVVEEGARLGTLELLRKPFSIHELVARVRARADEARTEEVEAAFTCVVADDDPPVLEGIASYLEEQGVDVVARAMSGREAIDAIRDLHPDVALVDVGMPGLDGLEVARRSNGTRVALYTGRAERELLSEALEAGAQGFILKEIALPELLRALEIVAEGGLYVDPGLAGELVLAQHEDPRPALTRREREVLSLVAKGMTNDRIGARLKISAETVQTHVRNAMAKLDASTRTEAVASALRASLIG